MKVTMITNRWRKFMLTAHITFSVGWLGAVLAYTALAIIGLVSPEIRMVKVVYPALELIGSYIIVPSSLAALFTGVIQSLGTHWGLFRYYWVSVKFLLTFVSSIILVNHMRVVSKMADMVATGKLSGPDFDRMRVQLLIHASGGLVILIFTTVLSVYKPWGKTIYGHRNNEDKELTDRGSTTKKSFGFKVTFIVIGLIVSLIILHLVTGGMGGHH